MLSRSVLAAVGAVAAAAIAGCGPVDDEQSAAAGDKPGAVAPPAAQEPDDGDPWFIDIAEAVGLDFIHTTGAAGDYYFPEIAGSGCGLLDYDNDGDLDVYVVQSYPLDGSAAGDPHAGANRLYRNDLTVNPDGSRRLRFVDVTQRAGVGDRGYGMGVAIADFDNDGDTDLYVTNFGPNTLYRNNGDGTFTDISDGTIPPEDRWSTSAAFVDYDRDGFVDLFVANYVNFTVRENKVCHSTSGRRDYCGPQSFDPVPDRLFRNNGDPGAPGFSDVTIAAGIDAAYGSGLGVVCADFNGDSRPDIYVANDGNANQLWINLGGERFENTALLGGAAYNAAGLAEAGMGVSAADFDLDGDLDIFLSHLHAEHNTLLVNDGHGYFDDRTEDFALAAMSWPYTGFGTQWADFNGDGYLDLFVANGAVKIVEEIADDPYPYGNPNQLILNLGPPSFAFTEISELGGTVVQLRETSRGAAFGDIDNDGDIDIIISNSNGPLRLLRNEVGHRRSWLALRLVGAASNRSAIGAEVRLIRARRPELVRRVHSDGSYCSANDLRVYFGLGDDINSQTVAVTWPGGLEETFSDLTVRQHHQLHEGSGEAPP
ncbi:MAG: CRTAC1 family protein [Planctomycetota bacterium]|nr:CRTAC1 family protein [Planctomycetota bacterium]